MVLTVDIGNTNIVLGVFDGDRLTLSARISTDKSRTSDEYSVMLKGIFEINGLDLSRFEGIILSSVVPQLNEVMCRALSRFTAVRVLTVGPGLRTGFQILADDPTELGADQVCNVAGALTEFAGPLVIADSGTATTLTVVNSQSNICGVIICPGLRLAAEALAGGTAQLPHIPLEGPVKAYGRNTVECMRTGIVGGTAAMIEGLVRGVERDFGEPVRLILTGGMSQLLLPHIERPVEHRPDLLVHGLYSLYKRNARLQQERNTN